MQDKVRINSEEYVVAERQPIEQFIGSERPRLLTEMVNAGYTEQLWVKRPNGKKRYLALSRSNGGVEWFL